MKTAFEKNSDSENSFTFWKQPCFQKQSWKKSNKKSRGRRSVRHSARRAAALLLSAVLLLGSAAGCASSPQPGASTTSGAVSESKAGIPDTAAQPKGTNTTGAAQSGGTIAAAAAQAADSVDRAGKLSASDPFILPYDAPDPAQKAAAYPWICSDLASNANKLEGLKETDDFHACANREWLTTEQIPSGYISYDTFRERQLEVDSQLLSILESNVSFSDPHVAHSQKLVQDYYEMWLDWDARNAAGVEPLRKVIQPLLDVSSLEEMTAYLSDPLTLIEALPLAEAYTSANINDAENMAVYISPPSLVFSDPRYYSELDADCWKTQPRYMYAAGYMLERLGYSNAERDRILKSSYLFECEMASHMRTTAESYSEDSTLLSNNLRTLQELKEEQGAFPLTGMLEAAGLSGSKVFLLSEPDWLACMRELYDEQHLEGMRSYLLVSDLIQFMDLLDRDCYDRLTQVRNVLSGSSGQIDDRKAASDATASVLKSKMGELYAHAYGADRIRSDVTALVNDIIDAYREMLRGEDFLSDSTKTEALKKLDTLTIRIASPEDSEYEKQEGGRVLDFRGPAEGGSLVEARIAISEYTCLLIADRVNQPVDRTEWIAAPQDVNAYYYPLDNSINIPIAILGGTLYHEDMSYEEILGHVGIIAAHEISHAFDTSGRQYDECGNLRNWWTEEDYRLFHARAQKLVDYYCGFEPIDGCPVSGSLIDTEAIADLAGVKCCLRLAASREDFDYDAFFRALAANWRCLTTIETEAYSIEQDSHPLAYLRTNAVVVQFEEFHKTYGTKEGDGMYLAPEYRLEVW